MARRSGHGWGGAFVAGLTLGSASACSDIVPLDCDTTPMVTDACTTAGTGGESSVTSGESTVGATGESDSGFDSGSPTEPSGSADTGSFCGDGVVDPGEECDDADPIDIDECSNDCRKPVCGDGVIQPGEDCDLGMANDEHGACKLDCSAAICGDGVVRLDLELCDGSDTLLETCETFGYPGGTLGCLPGCDGWDFEGCSLCANEGICDAFQPCQMTCESGLECWSETGESGTCLPACMRPVDCLPFEMFVTECAIGLCMIPCEQQECPEGMLCQPSQLYPGLVCLW